MKETVFFVKTGNQSILLSNMLRAADLAQGAIIRGNSGFKVTVQWKDGEIVDSLRIEETMQNLRKTFEAKGYCGIEIREIE